MKLAKRLPSPAMKAIGQTVAATVEDEAFEIVKMTFEDCFTKTT